MLMGEGPTCESRECHVKHHLIEIPKLYVLAESCLTPGNGGRGSSSGERSIGINVAALDYRTGTDILGILHSWERIVREEKRLTPPALVKHAGSILGEVKATCAFHSPTQ